MSPVRWVFTTGISTLSIEKTTLFETNRWYYEITMEGDPAGILKRNGCDKIYILMDGTRLKPPLADWMPSTRSDNMIVPATQS